MSDKIIRLVPFEEEPPPEAPEANRNHCINCRYYKKGWGGPYDGGGVCRVIEKAVHIARTNAKYYNGGCGPEGRWYEPKSPSIRERLFGMNEAREREELARLKAKYEITSL
jgi:hypothetical protein